MKAIPKSSFLLLNRGCTVSVDGVSITSSESPLPLLVGGTYLVFVMFDDNRDGTFSRVAQPRLGASGAYSYSQLADTFTPLTTDANDPFVRDLIGRSAGSFQELKGSIRRAVAAH
jgi:hypothetical protein